MQVLSRALIELYRLAESTPLDQFPGEVLRVFRDCFDYDGATLRMGEAHARSGLQITWSDLCRCDKSILQDYAELPAQDPITPMPMFLNSLSAPFRVDCLPLYRQQGLRDLDTSARKHGLRHLLVYGDSPVGKCIEYWILLCRTRDPGFTRLEVARLYYLWPHLSRVVDMNRSSALERSDASRARRALALVNTRGWIETADVGFSASLRLEWPGIEPTNLPQHVLDCLKREHAYRGRHIEITMKPQYGYLACQARSIDSLASLTRGEYVVASRFARGLTYKEIARELGVSHHTVRTQLTQVYSKLGVHDKAALAQYMMAHK